MTLTLEQKLAVHELLGRAAFAFDERDLAMLEDCFAADARFSMRIAGGDLVGPFEGREAIMGLMKGAMDAQTEVRRHVISNIFFDDEAEQATVISNLTLLATENGEIRLLSAGVYRDTLEEEGGRWRVLARHLDLDKDH